MLLKTTTLSQTLQGEQQMKKQCKNCTEAICVRGSSGKVYFCKMNPIPKKEIAKNFCRKYKKVNPNGVCDDYDPINNKEK